MGTLALSFFRAAAFASSEFGAGGGAFMYSALNKFKKSFIGGAPRGLGSLRSARRYLVVSSITLEWNHANETGIQAIKSSPPVHKFLALICC